ncbi:MAG: putative secondary metabolism biosynthetic enzyme, partial [Bogoriella megaspora]
NPYATPTQIANGWIWMHRTGDIGHLQADGSLTFRHRIVGDTQVKLRGLRIDLRDIETNLVSAADGALKAAVVTLRKGDPDFLVAHVVFSPQHNMENRDVFLEHLLGRLPIPQYMVPVLAVPLDEFPLTNHAKIDRKAILNLGLPRRVVIDDQSDAQLTETMAQLRQLWREVLGKGSENLGPKVSLSTNFFMIGGNSLLIVRLQSRIRQAFDVTVRLVDLLSANTLEQMARKVEQSAQVGVINWEEETKPQSIPSSQIQVRNVEKKGHMTILITGATGNLAKRLLPLLKAHSKVGRIFCVAVRDKPSEASRALLRAEKIVQYAGDLSAPRLGLSEQEFQTLSREVDVILHLGAVRSFWDNYHMLRLSNVQSTRELVQLAAPHQIPIHFVSTSGVLPRDILAVTGVAPSAAPYEPPSDGSDGYCASKWTSERLLERATEDLGVPSFIYRLHPPAHFPQSQQLKTGALDEFVRCVDLASAMPDCTGWEGHVDLIPGEQVARGLCDSLVSSARSTVSPGPTKTQFIRHDSTVTVSVDDIKTYLEEKRGKAGLERLQILKWMGRVKAVGFSYIIASLETTLGDGKGEDKLMSRR